MKFTNYDIYNEAIKLVRYTNDMTVPSYCLDFHDHLLEMVVMIPINIARASSKYKNSDRAKYLEYAITDAYEAYAYADMLEAVNKELNLKELKENLDKLTAMIIKFKQAIMEEW